MSIIINRLGKTTTSKRHRAVDMVRKMIRIGFISFDSIAMENQIKEILKWNMESIDSLDRVLDKTISTK
jgi:hypothetical protein